MTSPAPLPRPFLPLHSAELTLEDVGGKAINLAHLAQAGFPVPNAFFIPTVCYWDFVEANRLSSLIREALAGIHSGGPDSFETISQTIRTAFRAARIDPGFASVLELAWRWLGARPVAVRSSATAEDLPQASFAGQQDSFLNVIGEAALAGGVVECWSSLWTARAISYRTRNEINHHRAALAVVVQLMVPGEASGVMFTSNPVSGLRAELVIDATLGLGEALVGGLVEPDHYVVAKGTGEIIEVSLGSKAVALHSDPAGGVREDQVQRSGRQALPDASIRELGRLGEAIEQVFGSPQDVEWAYLSENGLNATGLSILQSRPITSLYPVPAGLPAEAIRVMFSFGAVQGMLDPMTPLGQDAIRLIFAGGASLFGIDSDHDTQGAIRIAGERLWVDITAIIRHPVGASLLPTVLGGVEPGSLPTIHRLLEDERMQAGSGRLRISTAWKIARFAPARAWRILWASLIPEKTAARIRRNSQAEIEALQVRADSRRERCGPRQAVELYRELRGVFVYAVPEIATGALAGLIPFAILAAISQRLTGSRDLALEITRGLPNNVTTEMDLSLWRTARAIRADPAARESLTSHPAESLAEQYLRGELQESAQVAIGQFLERYGMRGVAEIDIGRPRWRENPAQIIQTLQSYLQIEEGPQAPDTVFERGEQAAQRAVDDLQTVARKSALGWIKARFIRGAARRVRSLAGLRESPKFWIIQRMGIIRECLLQAGESLVEKGALAEKDDLFFLYLDELEALARGDERDWQSLISKRREGYRREMRRQQVPRLLLSDGRVFYEGLAGSGHREGQLRGSPVSPGVAAGAVRVVRDPHAADLKPGEILVCPGTDPAWTPLFLAAAGLVMEVGGMMTHGAIVAREYGIPAVVGVDRATERLQTGQQIRIDGSSGVIELLGQSTEL